MDSFEPGAKTWSSKIAAAGFYHQDTEKVLCFYSQGLCSAKNPIADCVIILGVFKISRR